MPCCEVMPITVPKDAEKNIDAKAETSIKGILDIKKTCLIPLQNRQ